MPPILHILHLRSVIKPVSLFSFVISLTPLNLYGQNSKAINRSLQYVSTDSTVAKYISSKNNDLFKCFDSLSPEDIYSITVCADIPDNNNSSNPVYENEPGHVFVTLSKNESKPGKSPVSVSFGFYPRYIAMILFIRKMPGEIRVSSEREYDVSVTKRLSFSEFQKTLFNAKLLAQRKYHLNLFNCYDYAIQLFNSAGGEDTLPVSRIKFPFTGGFGGSPCCLYKDLEKLKNKSSLASNIHFGITKAPVTCSKNFKP